MWAVIVAVLLVGVPIGAFATLQVRASAEQNLTVRAQAIARAVERRVSINDVVRPEDLDIHVSEDGAALDVSIEVTLPSGSRVTAGPDFADGPTIARRIDTPSGAEVWVAISGTAVALRMAQVAGLVSLAAAVAVMTAVGLARRQARRLAAPLVYLAASAEQIGSGQVRPQIERSGIEEIDLVAEELVRTSDRMAARLAAERQFSADASHQLRTPLTALTMRLEEIQMLAESEEVREEANIALEQVERLVGVVDDLLSSARKAAGGTTEVVAVADIFAQQAQEWAPTYAREHRPLVFEDPGQTVVLATPGSLAQVVATLLENSLTHGDGTTTVACRPVADRKSVVIEISDEGPGVPPDLAPRIFERSVTSGKGTGLGLALARDLVAADGGRLDLRQAIPPVFSIFLSAVPDQLVPDQVLPPGALVAVGRRRRRP